MRASAVHRWSFRLALSLVAYTYAAFPALVIVRGLLRPRPPQAAPIEPTVTIVIAARDEAAVIGRKLANLDELDYPSDCLDVVVASDGSTDATVDIVRHAIQRDRQFRVRILDLPSSGKAVCLDAAVASSDAEILVFSDANSLYAADAIRHLVRPFADPKVGGVAGNQVYEEPTDGRAERGERSYWSYDRLVKTFESRAGNVIGATGAIYAVRRRLVRPIPPGVSDDFFVSAGVIEQGYRLVFAPEAVAYEPTARTMGDEYGRKVRVVSRAMRCVAALRRLFNPRRYGFYSVQLLSHKVLRWSVGIPLAALLWSSAALRRAHPLYRASLVAQTMFYALAAGGAALRGRPAGAHPLLAVPFYFVMVNVAALVAGANLILGRRIDRWQPKRHAGGPVQPAIEGALPAIVEGPG